MPRGGARPGAGRPRKTIGKAKPRQAVPAAGPAPKDKSLTAAVRQAKDLTTRLLGELDAVTTHHGELEDLIIDETAGDRDPRRRNAMMRAIELPARAATLKVLLSATRAWAEIERTAKAKPAEAKQGKKAERVAAAKEASVGKFAPPPPPGGRALN